MEDKLQTPAVEAKPKTEAELMAELDAHMKKGDIKAVIATAKELSKIQKEREQTELEAKQKVLADVTEKVKLAISKALKPLVDAKELDLADGIWYTNDFGEKLTTCRLMKSAPKKSGGTGGGTGKKFAISTNDLLAKYGDQEFKDGQTFAQAFESNTDGNFRYGIRQKLLKLDNQV